MASDRDRSARAADPSRRARDLVAVQWAIERWAQFPVDADPRPLVLTGSQPTFAGFSDGAAKVAYLQGDLVAAGDIPEVVMQR
jgi:hypothetical protein